MNTKREIGIVEKLPQHRGKAVKVQTLKLRVLKMESAAVSDGNRLWRESEQWAITNDISDNDRGPTVNISSTIPQAVINMLGNYIRQTSIYGHNEANYYSFVVGGEQGVNAANTGCHRPAFAQRKPPDGSAQVTD